MSAGHPPACSPNSSGVGAAPLLRDIPGNLALNTVRWGRALLRAPHAHPPRPKALAFVSIAFSIAIVIAAMFFIDGAAVEWALHLPKWLNALADEVTGFGRSSWFLYPLGFVLLYLAAVTSPRLPLVTQGMLAALAARLGFVFLAIALPGLFTTLVKRMIGRARPLVGGDENPFLYMPFIWRPEYSSMPSGHATTAAAAAVAIGAVWPRARAVMWLYALIIVLSRIIVLAHHPSDVLGGAVVGVAGAYLVQRYFAERGLVFHAGDLRPRPGLSARRLKVLARTMCTRQ